MPKSQFINPDTIRQKGRNNFRSIPVNQYNRTIEEEKRISPRRIFLEYTGIC